MRGRISLGVLALVLAASQPAPAQGTKGFDGFKLVDKQGNISKPADYRDRYELLGTYTLIAEFDTTKHPSLLDMVGLENRLSDLLGAPVDLSPEDTLKEPVAQRAAREAVRAF
jgi:hypothetical protein